MDGSNKFAIKRPIKLPDGSVRYAYYDMDGNSISDLKGYQIIENDDLLEENKESIKPSNTDYENTSRKIKQRIIRDSDRQESMDPRGPSQRWGYTEKPGFMSITNMIPGTIGNVSRLASKAIDLKNQAATDQHRQALGLSPQGFMGFANAVVRGTDNKIADVRLGNSTVPVTFGGGLTPEGRTGLTTEEAMKRTDAIKQANVVEATRDQTKEAIENFKQNYSKTFESRQKTGVSSMFDKAKSFLSSLFNNKPASSNDNFTPNTTFADFLGYNQFPAAPQEPNNNNNGSNNSGGGASGGGGGLY